MRSVTWLSATALMLATAGCSYSDMGVGKGGNISAEQMRAYAFDQSGGNLPVPAVDHPGKGMAVQMDRMVTAQFEFTDGNGNPAGTGTVRFIHSSRDKSLERSGGYTFGYVSQKLLDAMAGMRAGGNRQVLITDSGCENLEPSLPAIINSWPANCSAVGAMKEMPFNGFQGHVQYPRGKPLMLSITIDDVCRPWILRKDSPDLMGGGPHVRLIEMWCR